MCQYITVYREQVGWCSLQRAGVIIGVIRSSNLSRRGNTPLTQTRSQGRAAWEERQDPERPAVPDLQPVALKIWEHVSCSPWFQAPAHPFPPVVLGLQHLLRPERLCRRSRFVAQSLMNLKRTKLWRKACTHHATGRSGQEWGSPRRRAAALREASGGHPSHLDPGFQSWRGRVAGVCFRGLDLKRDTAKPDGSESAPGEPEAGLP